MTSVLLVHDRQDVLAVIVEIVLSTGVTRDDISVAEDYYTARELLGKNIFDLMIVDLTIPFQKERGEASYTPVNELLNELFSMGTLNPPGDIIGITRDLEALRLIDSDLGPHLMVTIEEDREGRWKDYLKDKAVYARRSAETRFISVNRHYSYDALILTALDREMQPYQDYFEMRELKHFEGASEFLFRDAQGATRKGVAFAIGKSGQPSAASFAQALITLFRPQLALMSGYCGGVKGKVELGDAIFFETVYAWDYGKWEEEGDPPQSVFKARPNPIPISDLRTYKCARKYVQSDFNRMPKLLREVEQKSLGKLSAFKMRLCPVGSGSAVVANNTIVSQIRGLDDTIWAVDMESYGFYHAARNAPVVRPEVMCVKSVSDFCNGDKGDDLHEACSHISASIVIDILTNKWDFVQIGTGETELEAENGGARQTQKYRPRLSQPSR